MEKFACYDSAIKYIKNENNVGTNVLNKKPDYKNPNKLTKPMLVKNGDYMQITETTGKKRKHHQNNTRFQIGKTPKCFKDIEKNKK